MYTLKGNPSVHYLAMPRTASKFTRDILLSCGFVIDGTHHSIGEIHPGDIVLTTVRSHYDWFPSFWRLNGMPGKFHYFLKKTIRNSEWIKRNPDCTRCELYWQFLPLATHVMDFNKLGSQLPKFLTSIGISPPVINFKRQIIFSPYSVAATQLLETRFKSEMNVMHEIIGDRRV